MSASFVTETKDKEQGIKMSLSGMIFKLTWKLYSLFQSY
jgi:hypothetical protein